ncbi:MAG: hypothetical protein LBV80_11420 [Deltaproteobacteria bacterium]|nr:hypothetical protein [Deltaproteobacteria bacterium]
MATTSNQTREAIRNDWWQNKKGQGFTMFSDPGHGWLAVPRKELVSLGILNKISSFSYQKGDWVFLEEDCDFSAFVTARIEQNRPFFIIEKNSPFDLSPIRDNPPFNAEASELKPVHLRLFEEAQLGKMYS